MKILKIFGVVVGIHVFALMLIFANPGCSSTHPAAPSASDTVVKNEEPPPTVSVATPRAGETPVVVAGGDTPISAAPLAFDPNAPAVAVRFSPTRPGTPAAATLEAQPVGDVTPATTYTVGKGDSLWTIAKKHHITVAEIAAANNIKAGATVRLGQKLIIPGRPTGGASTTAVTAEAAPATPKTATTSAATPRGSRESVKHVVKPGEVLGVIARKYGVTVGDIATANNITDPAKIRPGMELTIPGWQAPKSAKTAAAKSSETAVAPAPVTTPAAPPLPAPEQDLDAGLQNKASEPPPVIKVDDSTSKP